MMTRAAKNDVVINNRANQRFPRQSDERGTIQELLDRSLSAYKSEEKVFPAAKHIDFLAG